MKKFIKKHPSAWRYISVLAILILVFPTIFITAYAGTAGKYIGLVGYAFVAFWGTFEVAKNLKISIWSSAYLGIVSLVMFVFPWDPMNPDYINISYSLKQIVNTFFSWKTFLVMLLGMLVILVEPNMKLNIKDTSIKMFIIFFTIMAISIFSKFAWVINMYHHWKLFYFLIIAIVADTFAYIGGKYLGKKMFHGAKLAPKISPKKTWAGFFIGFIVTSVFIGVVGWYTHSFEDTNNEILTLVVLSLVLPIVSVMGDLIFSSFKRYLNVKDFSNLLPGHGGILDRLDAMSVVLTFIWLSFLIL